MLQAWDLLHGNVLLRGWTMSDVSFYTTEIPQYMLVVLAHGVNADVVHIGAAMSYTLLVLGVALLARGHAAGREGAVRMLIAAGIMLAPSLGTGTVTLLSNPDHTGTAVPMLVIWLILGVISVRLYGFTPGQLALGLRVASVDNRLHVGIGRALVRGVLVGLVVPALFTDSDGRGVQDRVTATAVVRR